MDLHAGKVPGDKAVPDGRIETEDGEDSGGAKTALVVARRTCITEACFCKATEGE